MFHNCIEHGANVYGFTRSKKDLKNIDKIYLKNSKVFTGDASDRKFLKRLFNYFYKNKIILNGLINNAGQRQRKSFLEISYKEILKIFEVNFFSTFLISQYFIRNIKNKNSNSIVNIGSIVGKYPFADLTGYASTKSAIMGLTKSVALEFKNKNNNLRINCINPGFTKTSYFEKFKKRKNLYSWTLNKISAKRWGEANEISKLAIFLLSDKSKNINGEIINIDGGWL